MLIVTISIDPANPMARRKDIATIEICNVTDINERLDEYEYAVYVGHRMVGSGATETGRVEGHDRARGWPDLVARVLGSLRDPYRSD